MTTLYNLSSEQLRKQFHNGFGLRELKTVLARLTLLNRVSRSKTVAGKLHSSSMETLLTL